MVTLAEAAEISGGITKNAKRSALPIQRPYLSVANVHFNRIDTNNLSNIGVNEAEIARAQLMPGDLMVVEGNGSLSQLGRVAVWQGQVQGCLHQNHLIKVRPKPIAKSKWLLYWLMSSAGRRAIEATASSTSGLHTLSLAKVGSLPTPIASLEEQEIAIAYIELHLSRLDETVATLQGIQAKLKQARASILKAAVEGRLVEREANKSNARLLDHLSSQDQQEGIAIPEGWSIHQAKTVCNSIESGTTPSKEHLRYSPDEAVPFIKVYHLTFTGKLSFWENKPTYVSKEYHSSKMKRSLTIPGDVLTNIVGPPLGKVSVVPSKSHEWNINQAIARFRCGPTLTPAFLAVYLQSYQAQSWLASTSKTTTSQVNLSISNSRLLPIPVRHSMSKSKLSPKSNVASPSSIKSKGPS
jgi:type I restriction enzyme S subunit